MTMNWTKVVIEAKATTVRPETEHTLRVDQEIRAMGVAGLTPVNRVGFLDYAKKSDAFKARRYEGFGR